MYLDRELSWIEFNKRVLAEGLNKKLPPLERFRFLSIVSSNFDEFFMVRMAALKRLVKTGKASADRPVEENSSRQEEPASNPEEQLARASAEIHLMLTEFYRCLQQEIFPALKSAGLEFVKPPFGDRDGEYLAAYFMREIFPALTPLRFGPVHDRHITDMPVIANGTIYGAFLLSKKENGDLFPSGEFIAMVKIPPALDRVVFLPEISGNELRWVLLDDLLMIWGNTLFSGYTVHEKMLFRINRDADFSVDEKRDEDFIEAMEEVIADREHSPVIRMVYSPGSPLLKEYIARRLELSDDELYPVEGPINPGSLWRLLRIQGFDRLKIQKKSHHPHPAFSGDQSMWDCIKRGDILLACPYFSFDPVIRFFREAAEDPQVISIKTALYRTSGDSPVVQALEQAALSGKNVTAVVELKARFDEERNISWAVRLEKAGVIVIYGLSRLKIHAKITQIIRREPGGIVRYVHLSTGNYNDRSSRQYSDLSLFTVNEDFGKDATILFNMLSGYSIISPMNKFVTAPWFLKQRFLELIGRETRRAKEGAPGKIIAKMNALVDTGVINALYEASRAGVKVMLNIRGICTLVPGVKGFSDNITVISIIDYYLEHSRVFYFYNGGAEEFYISSADWMPRNLDRRVELLVPVLDPEVKEEIREILECYFLDTTQSWILQPDGSWKRIVPEAGTKPFQAQEYLLDLARRKADQPWKTKQELVVRRGIRPAAAQSDRQH